MGRIIILTARDRPRETEVPLESVALATRQLSTNCAGRRVKQLVDYKPAPRSSQTTRSCGVEYNISGLAGVPRATNGTTRGNERSEWTRGEGGISVLSPPHSSVTLILHLPNDATTNLHPFVLSSFVIVLVEHFCGHIHSIRNDLGRVTLVKISSDSAFPYRVRGV